MRRQASQSYVSPLRLNTCCQPASAQTRKHTNHHHCLHCCRLATAMIIKRKLLTQLLSCWLCKHALNSTAIWQCCKMCTARLLHDAHYTKNSPFTTQRTRFSPIPVAATAFAQLLLHCCCKLAVLLHNVYYIIAAACTLHNHLQSHKAFQAIWWCWYATSPCCDSTMLGSVSLAAVDEAHHAKQQDALSHTLLVMQWG